jgi:hypothetical protein
MTTVTGRQAMRKRKSGYFEEARQLLVRALAVTEGLEARYEAVLQLRLMHALRS